MIRDMEFGIIETTTSIATDDLTKFIVVQTGIITRTQETLGCCTD